MFVVICYALHAEGIASHDAFEVESDAVNFLRNDAETTYHETDGDDVKLDIAEDGWSARLSADDDFIWTWEIIKITKVN